jgi:hypothetical protein
MVGVLVAIADPVAVRVPLRRIGSEQLLAQVAETIAVRIFG